MRNCLRYAHDYWIAFISVRILLKSHRLAYKNVINYKGLWDKTTDNYKAFIMQELFKYTIKETNRKSLDSQYLGLYNKYHK